MTGANVTIRTDEILNHMRLDLKCLTDVYHNWRLGKNVYSLGCTERHRITLYYQQVRAFNLVYALEKKGLLMKDTKICILGAGPAGVAAASAAAILGAEVVLLEEKADIFGVLGKGCNQNKRRLFHPKLDKWPNPEWLNNKAELPLYDWEQKTDFETSPHSLRCQFEGELQRVQNCHPNKLRVFTGFHGQPEWANGQWRVDFGQSSEWPPTTKSKDATITTFDAKILILAFGFGGDKKSEYTGSFGYFEDDAELWGRIEKLGVPTEDYNTQCQNTLDKLEYIAMNAKSITNAGKSCCNQGNEIPPQIIVSGSGDGALIEAINVVFHSNKTADGGDRAESLNWLFPALVNLFGRLCNDWNDLVLKLQELEEVIASAKFTSDEMLSRYKQLGDCDQYKATLKEVDEKLKNTFNARRKVYLFHKDRLYMGVKNFAFLRFLVWRLVSMGWILPRRIAMTPEIYNTWQDNKREREFCDLEFSSSGLQWKFPGIHSIIPRHGPSWPFSKQSDNYPHLDDSAKMLQELNKQDKTREVIWDADFTQRLKTSGAFYASPSVCC